MTPAYNIVIHPGIDQGTGTSSVTYTLPVSSTPTVAKLSHWLDAGVVPDSTTGYFVPVNSFYNTQQWPAQTRQYQPTTKSVPPRRQPPPLEFNRYINASDLLEEFIRYLGTEGVRQREVMGLPIELFIKWLVIRAYEEDGQEPDVAIEIPQRTQPRCLTCRRFIPRVARIPFDSQRCANRYFERELAA